MDRGGDVWRERAIRDAVLGGDTAAWRAWYDDHFARLAAYVAWRCGNTRGHGRKRPTVRSDSDREPRAR